MLDEQAKNNKVTVNRIAEKQPEEALYEATSPGAGRLCVPVSPAPISLRKRTAQSIP